MSKVLDINPDILAWAREAAGLDLDEAAEKLGFTTTKKATAAEKLALLEAGDSFPTRNQLEKIASVYRRPLITFYMKERPIRGERGEDFRKTTTGASRRENALLDALLRELKARQEMVKALLEDDETPTSPLACVAKYADGVDAIVNLLVKHLNFDSLDITQRKGGPDVLFKKLRQKTEDAGVFVLLAGDLGSHHTALSADVFRGFAIADKVAPFIVINDKDARAARAFTLIHELAHIVIGESGVSGTPITTPPTTPHEHIERLCNDVAGEFLLSAKALGKRPDTLKADDKDSARTLISGVSSTWAVSEPMAAYRLNRFGWISDEVYQQLIIEYAARWREFKQKQKDERGESEGGPDYYITTQSRLGSAILGVVHHKLRENVVTHTKAAKILGISPTSVEPLLKRYEMSRGIVVHDGGLAS